MSDEPRQPTIAEILASDANEPTGTDPLSNYIKVTPRALAVLSLRDCRNQLERFKTEPLRLAQAAKSAHLALQSALTDALAGSTSIGAYDDKLRAEYLAYFEASRDGDAIPPESDRVMPFQQLLARAMEHPLEWSGQRLSVSPEELIALGRLTFVRHRVEHPRPQSHLIEPLFIARTLPVAARLTLQLLDVGSHHYSEDERLDVQADVCAIACLCREIC